MRIKNSLNVQTLVITKKRISNMTDCVDYLNAGPTMVFLSVFTHSLDGGFVTPEYVNRLMVAHMV